MCVFTLAAIAINNMYCTTACINASSLVKVNRNFFYCFTISFTRIQTTDMFPLQRILSALFAVTQLAVQRQLIVGTTTRGVAVTRVGDRSGYWKSLG